MVVSEEEYDNDEHDDNSSSSSSSSSSLNSSSSTSSNNCAQARGTISPPPPPLHSSQNDATHSLTFSSSKVVDPATTMLTIHNNFALHPNATPQSIPLSTSTTRDDAIITSTTTAEAAAATTTTTSLDQERQILLLMLLAQVCALHDVTPKTFTVHVLELYERGILDPSSIHFLYDLGLVTPHPIMNTTNSSTTNHLNQPPDSVLSPISSTAASPSFASEPIRRVPGCTETQPPQHPPLLMISATEHEGNYVATTTTAAVVESGTMMVPVASA